MSKDVFVEIKKGEVADAILCEYGECQTIFYGEAADQHMEQYPNHIVTPLKREVY